MKKIKKVLLLIILLLVPVMMSGCERNKTITCTKSGKSIYVSNNTTMLVTLKGNKNNQTISNVSRKENVVVQKQYKKYLNIMKASLKNTYGEYKGKGVTKSVKSKDLLISTTVTFNTNNMSKGATYTIDGLKITKDKKVTEKGIVKSLKSYGYKCEGEK